MANKDFISDELLAAFLEGNVNKEEMEQVLEAVGTDAELRETLDIALQIEEEEHPILQMAAEGGRNLCEIQCEAYVLRQRGIQVDEEDLLEVAKDNHWIKRAGTPLQFMGNLMEYMGLKVSRRYGAHIEDIKEALRNGDSVIVAVDSDKLYPERPDEEDATNHAIVVTGIDQDLETVKICDPEDLTEKEIETTLFMSAWRESNYYMVNTINRNSKTH